MPMDRVMIDFEIIWKKINHSLTEEEEILFSNWLDEDPSHLTYYENAKRFYLEGNDYKDFDTLKAWKLVDDKIRLKKSNLRLIISVSIAAAIFLIFNLLPSSLNNGEVTQNTTETIRHGSSQASLILDDGSVIDLSASKVLQLAEGGSDINIEGSSVKYSEKSKTAREIKYNTLSVPRGGEFFLELSDGSKVWLNSETTLRYPVQFGGNERRVELTGEAYFEVAKNEKIPFIVESGNQFLRVLGTEFNISSYLDESFTYSTLVKGSIKISLKGRPEVSQTLVPGEQGSASEGGISKHKVDIYKYIAWKDGRFVFEDQTLEEIMKTLSRWYDIQVVFTNEELKNIRFTGNLQRYSNFDELINKIRKTNEVNFVVENRTITII